MSKPYDLVYCRVSSDEQRDNTSLGQQEEVCTEYVKRVFSDANILVLKEDYSGFEESRPELDKARELMRSGKVRSFTAMRVDRLCRKARILEEIRDFLFKPHNVRVFTPNDLGEWQWNPMHETMQEYYAVMASNWGKMAVLVMSEGRKAHLQKGNVITAGNPPYGLTEVVQRNEKGRRISSTLGFNQDESKVVLRIFELLVSDRFSVHRIVTLLNSDKTPTLTQSRGKSAFPVVRQSLSSHQWRASTIRQILRSPVYDGRWQYGKKRNVKLLNGKIKKVPNKENLIEISVPALIPHEIWLEAQTILDKNRIDKRGRPVEHDYLCSKRIKCQCGYRMTSYTVNGKYQYYRCPNEVYYIKAGLTDDIAFSWLYDLLKDKDKLRNKINDYVSEKEKLIEPLQRRLDIIDRMLNKKNAEHDVLIANYMRLPEIAQGKVLASIEQLEEEIKEYNIEGENLQHEIDKHESNLWQLKTYLGEDDSPEAQAYRQAVSDLKDLGYRFEWLNFDEVDRIKAESDEPLTYAEKRRYVEDFDLRVEVINVDGIKHLRLVCKVGSDVLPLLDNTSACVIQNQQRFYLSFSDTLRLDFSSLKQFEKVEAM